MHTRNTMPVVQQLLSLERGEGSDALWRHPPRDTALRARVETLEERASRVGVALPYVGTTALFAEHRVYIAEDHDWVLMPLAEDPLYLDRDGYPLPSPVLRRLKTMVEADIEFDTLYVAHELATRGAYQGGAADKVSLIPAPSRAAQHLSQRLGRAIQAGWGTTFAPLRAAAKVGLAMGALGLAALPIVAAATLDPMLFGAVVAPGRQIQPGEPASWFLLGAWDYGEEGR